MKDSNLTMQLTLTVSGGLGWQEGMRASLESIGALIEEANLLEAKGDGASHTFEYKIRLENSNELS
jgi:hypothetical protein